jgi:ABC-type transport system involved in cytochrome c biogenesis permease subunit
MKKLVYYSLLLLALLIVVRALLPQRSNTEMDIAAFGQLPVQVGGRIKPLDTVARNTLLILSGRQKVVTREGQTLAPIVWLMDLTMRPELADSYPIFKIEFPDDLGFAGLAQKGERYYAFNELKPHFEALHKAYSKINKEAKQRTAYEKQIAELNDGLSLYHRVLHALHPIADSARLDRLSDEYQSYQALANGAGIAELRKQQAGEPYDAERLNQFIFYADDYLKLNKIAYLDPVPPADAASEMDDWKNIGLALLDVMKGDALSPVVTRYGSMIMAYRSNDVERFNQDLAEQTEYFADNAAVNSQRIAFEQWFNQFQPFYVAIQLYVLVFFIVCIAWLRWPTTLGKAAYYSLILAFLIHSFGLLARMYLQGRPPITNLYSSAVFVGWGAVLLGIFIERFQRNGVGAAMASLVGFATLIIAHHLAMGGDTLEMMRAVLDSNFWLATHVIIITFGYSAMFLAGALAIIFIGMGLFKRDFDAVAARSLNSMVYGITCFAALFSLVGTILGGIWADQSWGRFWGWDPKENGALMIVLMAAIYLHARWGGICRERGLMNLAICGNIVTAWSWFGTNLLGVGLHSYGFTDSGFYWMLLFIASQVFVMLLGAIPWRFWRSQFGQSRAA